MAKNNKAKGSRRERKCMEILESQGWHCTKSGGSLGALDVVALRDYSYLAIQVKSNRPPDPAERQALEQLGVQNKEIWIFHDRRGHKVYRWLPAIQTWLGEDGQPMIKRRTRTNV